MQQQSCFFFDGDPFNDAINSFEGEYRFLSNFHPALVALDGVTYSSVEHAYVASKTSSRGARKPILEMTPGQAKRYGRTLEIRGDFDSIKLSVMENLLSQKFSPDTELAKMLQDTGVRMLIEGNTWGDTFWGICNGIGENHLGRLLMKIRRELNDLGGQI